MNNQQYDALLIGAGPAGSCASAILAEYGHRVLVLEREKFPRYHIGESLIPFTFGPLERIGMIPKMKKSHFVKKYSVTFVQPDGRRSQPFYFFTRYDRETVAQTWQVLRSEFDQMLLDNAREKGAEVREETSVNRLLMDGERVVGVENMRQLVYAFYDPAFSFREVINRHPEAAGMITDCLSGDVNKDFSQLWGWIGEFVSLPEDLPYGEPLLEEQMNVA